MTWIVNYTNILTFIVLTSPSHFPVTCDLITLLPLHPYLFFSIFTAQQRVLQVIFFFFFFFFGALSLLYSPFYCLLSLLYSSLIYCLLLIFFFFFCFVWHSIFLC